MSSSIELKHPFSWLHSLWKFSRPHTIIGTSLSVIGVYIIAVKTTGYLDNFGNKLELNILFPLLAAWLACICGNIYIVGLNQLEDVEIDKINKPHLPLASGEFSMTTGKRIVTATGLSALILAGLQGNYLLAMVAISLAIGTMYSLPPIRLKRFPFWAAICIFSVRGAIVNLGLFLHFSDIFHTTQSIPVVMWMLTWFVLVFTIAIAIFKDIPDLEGDKQYNINTFTIKLGQKTVFNLSLAVITVCYLVTIAVTLLPTVAINRLLLITSHLFLLGCTWWLSRGVNLQEKSQIASFYQFIWKLFFLEYLLFPLACVLV